MRAVIAMVTASTCLVEIPESDTTDPHILVTVGSTVATSQDDLPGGDFACANLATSPAHVQILVTDAGGVESLYVHMIDGRVIEDSVTITPDAEDLDWHITIGDTVLSEGDDELNVQAVPLADGTVRTAVTVDFDIEGPDKRPALQTLAYDYAGNTNITWPLLVHVEPQHGPCP